MARTLDQILADLNPAYDPQRASIATQQSALPAQYDAQQAGLQAQADQANQGILSQAQQRGLGFSGIPVAEQAKYNATTFMPAVANLKTQQIQQQTSLSDQLAKLNGDQRTQALGYQQQELDRDQQAAQFAAQQKAALDQFNRQLAASQATARASAASSGGAINVGGSSQASQAPSIQSLFQGYRPHVDRNYTEAVVIPTLVQNGYSQAQAAKMAYDYRKQAFGE